MATVLVIDDDRSVLRLIQNAFQDDPDIKVNTAAAAEEGFALLQEEPPDVVLLDVMLPDRPGMEAFRQIRRVDAKLPVIFITVGGESDTVIEAMKLGAFDFLLKPLDLARVREVVGQALEMRRLMHVPVRVHGQAADETNGDSLVGRAPEMQDVYKAIGRVAPQDVTVLILGESGTGKELVARAIYHHSTARQGPLFGRQLRGAARNTAGKRTIWPRAGSFTGTTSQHIGKFEQCTGGTLFLDEVGDMSPLMQSKVLRVLQEQQFERVGGTQTIQPTCGSSPPRTAIWKTWWPRANSARTCTTD